VCAAPLPFGAAPAWAWAPLALAVGALVTVWGGGLAFARLGWRAAARPAGWTYPLAALVLAWAGVQSVHGLPGAHPVWAELAGVLADAPAGAISADPAATRAALARLGMVGGAAVLALHLGGGTADRERLLTVLVFAAAGYGLYALAEMAAGWDTVLGAPQPAYRDAATAPFINRNAFAAYAGTALVTAAALLAATVRRRGWLALIERAWPVLAAALVLAAAVVGSQSRGGLAATAVGVVAVAFARPRGREPRWLAWGVGGGVVLAAGGALALLTRWGAVGEQVAERLHIYAATLELIADRPLLGHGAGAFAAVFPGVRPLGLDTPFVRAHSVYLEAAATLGLPATLVLLTAVATVAVACWRTARGGSLAGRAGLGAAVLAGTHGLIDFAPQVPAVAVTLAAVTGLGAARPAHRGMRLPDGPSRRATERRVKTAATP